MHPFLDRPHSPPQTASESVQPFCHNTLFGQTDGHTQTDRWSRRQVHNMSAPLAILIESDALKTNQKQPFSVMYHNAKCAKVLIPSVFSRVAIERIEGLRTDLSSSPSVQGVYYGKTVDWIWMPTLWRTGIVILHRQGWRCGSSQITLGFVAWLALIVALQISFVFVLLT